MHHHENKDLGCIEVFLKDVIFQILVCKYVTARNVQLISSESGNNTSSIYIPSQVGCLLHISSSVVEFSSHVCSELPLSVNPGSHITLHVSISLLVHGYNTNPLSGAGALQISGCTWDRKNSYIYHQQSVYCNQLNHLLEPPAVDN